LGSQPILENLGTLIYQGGIWNPLDWQLSSQKTGIFIRNWLALTFNQTIFNQAREIWQNLGFLPFWLNFGKLGFG